MQRSECLNVAVQPFSLPTWQSPAVALKGLVCAGLGTSCMPKELFQSEIDSGKLEVLITDPPAPSVKYYAAFMRQNHAALGYAIADLAKKCC